MIKNKLLLLLALLMTAATGAWAQGPVDGTIVWPIGDEGSATVSASIKDAISSTSVTTGSGLTVGSSIYFDTNMVKYTPTTANAGNVEGVMIEYRIEAVDGYKFKPTGVDYAAVKVGNDNLSYSWSYTIDGVESAITDVSYTSVLRSNGGNSGTAQLMHSESITADGCSVFTLRFYISNCGTTKNICIGNITISGSVSAAAAGYTVSLKDGVKDADKWTVKVGEGQAQALPIGGLKGDGSETVTLQYNGRLKVKGVKATSDAAAPSVPDGALSGVFSVSSTKQVYFSKGNLRYASSKWSFFDNQYDYYTGYSADAWDHFGWSTSATTYGMNTSTDNGDYSGDFVDWGATMGTGWFTLSKDEWTYLFKTRSASTVGGTENGRYAKAKVNNVPGIILFPDTYTHPDGVTAPVGVNATGDTGWNGNSYTVADWTKMESAGCVFLPAAGYREGSSVTSPGSYGYYWSATPSGTNNAYRVYSNSRNLNPENTANRRLGLSVRLVCEGATSDAAPAAPAGPTLTLGEMTQGGDPISGGSGSGTYYAPTFSAGQQVAVFYKNTSGQTVKVLSDALTASDISNEGKSATINVTIDDADKTQPVTYFYPATMAKDDGTINFNFTAQSGTEASLSTVRNCCKGSGAWDGNALPSVSMASQIAIWKLSMTHFDEIFVTKVTVKVGGNSVAEASTTSDWFDYPIDVYLALNPATMGTGTLRIEADEYGEIYYYQKAGGVSLTAGKYYQSTFELEY